MEDVFPPEGDITDHVCDMVRWFLPDYIRTSRLLSDLFAIQTSCAGVRVFTASLIGTSYLKDIVSFVCDSDQVVVIPLILESTPINHAVVILVDRSRNHVVYYDPKGANPMYEFRKPHRVMVQDGTAFTLLVLCAGLQKATNSDVLYGDSRDQSYFHPLSCGLYCSKFIERYVLYRESVLPGLRLASAF